MTDNIIPHDFGKDAREHARNLARLLNLLAERDDDMLREPGKYFEMASKRLHDQNEFIRKVEDALRPAQPVLASEGSVPNFSSPETIVVRKSDYEALRAVRALFAGRSQS